MVTTNHSLPSDADFARLEGELFARIDKKHRGQVLRHRLAAVAIVAVVAGAGVAAGTVANPASQQRYVSCYSSDSTSSAMQPTALSNWAVGAPASKQIVKRAVNLCDALWTSGVIGNSVHPKLQACLADNLTLSVFPRKNRTGTVTQFCERLGMSKP